MANLMLDDYGELGFSDLQHGPVPKAVAAVRRQVHLETNRKAFIQLRVAKKELWYLVDRPAHTCAFAHVNGTVGQQTNVLKVQAESHRETRECQCILLSYIDRLLES